MHKVGARRSLLRSELRWRPPKGLIVARYNATVAVPSPTDATIIGDKEVSTENNTSVRTVRKFLTKASELDYPNRHFQSADCSSSNLSFRLAMRNGTSALPYTTARHPLPWTTSDRGFRKLRTTASPLPASNPRPRTVECSSSSDTLQRMASPHLRRWTISRRSCGSKFRPQTASLRGTGSVGWTSILSRESLGTRY